MNASVLRASPCLRGLPPRRLKLLAAAAQRRTFDAGTPLPTAAPPRLYLVVRGEVGVWASTDGVAEVVAQEGPGAMLGSVLSTGDVGNLPVYRAASPLEAGVWTEEALHHVFAQADGLEHELTVRLSLRAREDELVGLLRRTPLFQHVSQSLIRWVLQLSTLQPFQTQSTICRKGDEGDAMFIVVAGEIAIGHEDGNTLARLHRGDFFGEIALVQSATRMSTATALADAEILVIPKAAFDVLDARSPAFRHAVRLTAQERLEVNVAGPSDPDLVWLVSNDPRCPAAKLAVLLAQALAAAGTRIAEPKALQTAQTARAAIDAAAREHAARAVVYSDGPVPERLAQQVAAKAGSVVVVDGDATAPALRGAALHRVHHVVVLAPDAAGTQPVHRDAILLRAHPRDLRRAHLDGLPDGAKEGLRRVARAVSRRRVGLALGGGAAWGYAHVALVRALEEAEIPIDLIAGVSMGAIVGAFYASHGLAGMDRLMDANLEISAAAIGAVASTRSVSLFIRRHIPQTRIEDLNVPFAALAVDARTARERVFRHGSLTGAVRASCSLPGVFAPSILAGHRYLDGAVRHNVPASTCVDAGADFVIACDVVPLPGVPRGKHRRGLTGFVLDTTGVNRVSDAVRSLYWLSSDSGQRQASVADAIFSPDLAEFEPWDFPRAKAMVAQAHAQLDAWLPATVARYAALVQQGPAGG